MPQWFLDNQDFLTFLGQIGSFLSGIFAAIAAMLSLRAIGVAKEESSRNRISFEFSWQPMLKTTIKGGGLTTVPPAEVALPKRQIEIEARELPTGARSVATDFAHWRQNFGNPEYANGTIDSPHPNTRYLMLNIENLQPNPSGQAIDITIELEFEYPLPSQSYPKMTSRDCEYTKRAFLLSIEHISPLEEALIYLVDIESVPNIRARIKSLEYKTWNDIKVTKGIIGGMELMLNKNVSTNTNIATEVGISDTLVRERKLIIRPEWITRNSSS